MIYHFLYVDYFSRVCFAIFLGLAKNCFFEISPHGTRRGRPWISTIFHRKSSCFSPFKMTIIGGFISFHPMPWSYHMVPPRFSGSSGCYSWKLWMAVFFPHPEMLKRQQPWSRHMTSSAAFASRPSSWSRSHWIRCGQTSETTKLRDLESPVELDGFVSKNGGYSAGWWFGTFFIFPYIGNNHPNWLIFFREVQTTNQSGYPTFSMFFGGEKILTNDWIWGVSFFYPFFFRQSASPDDSASPGSCSLQNNSQHS